MNSKNIYDQAYFGYRNRFVRYIAEQKIDKRRIGNYGIKKLLIGNSVKNIEVDNSNNYVFTFNREDLLSALKAEILMFYTKSVLQYNDYLLTNRNHQISANWDLVTGYYSAYADASLLLRLVGKGNIYFDSEYQTKLYSYIARFIGDKIGDVYQNSFFTVDLNNGTITISKSTAQVHQAVWREISQLLHDMLLLSRQKSDEFTILQCCSEINKALTDTFPSQIRNAINYRSEYSVRYLRKQFIKQYRPKDFIRVIWSFDGKSSPVNINEKVSVYLAYTAYLHDMTFKYMQEFFEIGGESDFISDKIQRLYTE